jgi:hypothetical protein
MPDPLVRFAARNYAGTQKMLRSEADRLRTVDPGFLILHYRLGEGLGYREVSGDCDPNGDFIRIVEGDEWIREWPDAVDDSWFYPYAGAPRVLLCDWGWYLADLDSPSWRAYWHGEVLRQLQANDDDGVFMDSLSVPNYFGGSRWRPNLPDVDAGFEADWARRIDDWLAWLQTQPVGQDYYLVPNVGSWITTRDPTTYAAADGVMIEGFALEGDGNPYAPDDWRLQADRVLSLARAGKAVIGQTYVSARRERGFALGTYLLLKHERFYLNIEQGFAPEWWPEYDVPIGKPRESAARVADLFDDGDGVYERRFSRGLVLVNPEVDGATRTVRLAKPMYLVRPRGGGDVPDSGDKPGRLGYRRVSRVNVRPYSAAVLLSRRPGH